MSRFTSILAVGMMATITTSAAFAQVNTPEVEPNGDKTEATVVTGMLAGDCITGASNGAVGGAGNVALNTDDYWDISTAPLATPGWYRWTLTINAGNDLEIHAQSQSGSPGSGGTVNVGSDTTAQSDSVEQIHWYSNEGVSRLYVVVDGSSSSPASYSACLSCTPVASTAIPGTFAAGMIQITSVGQTTGDTDLSIADSSRTIIPGYLNDDDGVAMPGLQSELTRMYTPGTYYVVISDYDQSNSEPAAIDEDFIGGDVMDFPNCYVNGTSTTTGDDLTFLIDDGAGGTAVTPVTKNSVFGFEFLSFTVGSGGTAALCTGDGGNQMGCTNCPCSNNAPVGTIGGCLNSAGTSSSLQVSGDPSVSLPSGSTTDLRFSLSGVPSNAFCILNSGDGLAPGNPANPCFGLGTGGLAATFDGLRCAIMNTRRHGGRSADVSGDVGVTNNPWGGEGGPPVGIAQAGSGFVSGQTRYFQVINRDDPLAVCMRGLNTSQAAMITFTP